MSDISTDSSGGGAATDPLPKHLDVSLFHLLQKEYGAELPLAKITKSALVELSHFLEDTVIKNRLPATVFTGFQYGKYWQDEINRYRKMTGLVKTLCIFAGFPQPKLPLSPVGPHEKAEDELDVNMVMVRLAQDDALRQEWFLIVLTAEFSVLLCGLDRLEPYDQESSRLFDTIITFEPGLINRALDILDEVLEHYRPDRVLELREGRQLFPPVAPTPTYLTLLMAQYIERASYHRQKAHELDTEQAMRATIARLLHDASQPVTTILSLLQLSKKLNQIEPEEIDMLLEVTEELVEILERMRELNRFRTSKYANTVYLDTGKPLF